MLTEREVSASIGGTAYSTSGDKIGTVDHYFVDDRTGVPSWVAVTTGLFGTRHSIVPATEAMFADGALHVPVTPEAVKNAPRLAGNHLEPAEEAQLREHYRLGGTFAGDDARSWTQSGTDVAAPTAVTDAPLPPPPPSYGVPGQEYGHDATGQDTGRDTTGHRTDGYDNTEQDARVQDTTGHDATGHPTDGGMVRNEERLRISTEQVAATRVRLVKYVVTEEVQITVPIRREEIRIEEVPIDAPDHDMDESLLEQDDRGSYGGSPGRTPGTGIGSGGLPEEIVLHTERPIVSVEVVPRERVRLRTELVQGQETVTGQVQREEIVVDQTPTPGFDAR